MNINILIVDDHRILRQGLVLLLDQEQDMHVVGEASDGREAVQLAHDLKPDVIVMDIAMPNLNGLDAARQIHSSLPGVQIIVLSARGDRDIVGEALRAGVSGYLVKDAAMDDLIEAVRAVQRGERYLGPRLAQQLEIESARTGQNGDHSLSPREREVLQLLAEGKAMKEAAAILGVSVKTVETHRRALMEKLSLYSVAELTKFAIRAGLTSIDS